MFNIFSHQGNSNSNSNEIPPRRIDYYQESIQWHTNAAKGTGSKEQKLVHSPWKSMWKLLKQIKTRADGMAQLLEALAAKSDNLSSIFDPRDTNGRRQPSPTSCHPTLHRCERLCLFVTWLFKGLITTAATVGLTVPTSGTYTRKPKSANTRGPCLPKAIAALSTVLGSGSVPIKPDCIKENTAYILNGVFLSCKEETYYLQEMDRTDGVQ